MKAEKPHVVETRTYTSDQLRLALLLLLLHSVSSLSSSLFDYSQFCKDVFMHFEISEEDADIASDVLITADLRGIDSHGVFTLYNSDNMCSFKRCL